MDVLCDIIAIFVPFSMLLSLIYILYLITLNKFAETKRSFITETIVEFSQEGREWANLYFNAPTVEPVKTVPVDTKKEEPRSFFSGIFSNPLLMTTILPMLVNTMDNMFKSKGEDQVADLLRQLIDKTDTGNRSLSAQLIASLDEINSTLEELKSDRVYSKSEKEKVEVKEEPASNDTIPV